MHAIVAILVLLVGCKNEDVVGTVPEPTPDGPVADAAPDGVELCAPPPCCGDALCSVPDESCKTCPGDCGECGCCVNSVIAGCGNDTVKMCVCGSGAPDAELCCTDRWDQTCVEDVDTLGCGTCDCCAAHETIGGCVDQTISDCVCAQDYACCSEGWDAACVDEVATLGCGSC